MGVSRALALAVAMAALWAAPAGAAVQLSDAGTFTKPIFVTAPPSDGSRLFVVERDGRIQLIHDGVRKQFLDISSTVSTGGERGLLSMAFAPDYTSSGLFYTFSTESVTGDIRIDEFRRSAADPDAADPASRRVVMDESHTQTNHNGGQLQFGPDGYLYATIGDNANSANAPNLSEIHGKILRIDPRAGQPLVPADNPWAAQPGTRGEIWARGLRNPWRSSFDRETGDLTIADVGAGSAEEVNFVTRASGGGRGLDFGWPSCEGFCATPQPQFTDPVLEQDHAASGFCAIVGGYIVRAADLPSLAGRYVYGDYCADAIRSFSPTAGPASDRAEGLNVAGLVSFGEDACGHVYAISETGPVRRLSEQSPPPACAATPPPAQPPAQQPQQPQPQPAQPDPAASADTTRPVLFTRYRKRQGSARTRRVVLWVRCSEPCRIEGGGRLYGTGAKRRPRLMAARFSAAAPGARRMELRLAAPTARRVRKALRAHRRVVARIRLDAVDTAGNRARPKFARIRIVR